MKEIHLRVAEAQSRDVGRGIVRLDPQDMERLGVSVGEIVEIEGKRKTAAKTMPAYPEDRGKLRAHMDGILRENGQVGLGESVSIRPVPCPNAERVGLTPLTPASSLGGEGGGRGVGRFVEGLPVVVGDRIRANLFGARACEFKVVSTSPKGIVLIHPNTSVAVEAADQPAKGDASVSYEDIGGLGRQIHRIREMIELPLRYPQVFERLGIDAPKGVFLHGPPGCGKTLIARAVANETAAHFAHIRGPEIIGKFYGESEARLRSVFEDAQRRAPSILFIDEIDSIAPKREEMGGEKQVERRVVGQLLSLMDGLESRGQVIVIGATNLPNSIYPALRRPGRFDREIVIPIPDRNGRLEVLQIHTRGMPLSEGVDLGRLAQITHGFVGADLQALCREAAMASLRRIMPRMDFNLKDVPDETLLSLQVGMDDFLEALKEVEPSAIREVFVEVPDVRWADVGGLKEAKERLQEAVEWPLRHPRLFEKAGLRPAKGILIHGAPGAGKTLLAKAAATESEVNFIAVSGPALTSKYVGESERAVRDVFRKARQASPTILFFDEIDSLVPVRGTGDSTHVTERILSQFLTEMDGIEESKGVLVLAATNRLDLIDPALLRPGRFDLVLEAPFPTPSERLEILRIHAEGKPLDADVDLGAIARAAENQTGADLADRMRRAAMAAMREFLEGAKSDAGLPIERFKIARRHFEEGA